MTQEKLAAELDVSKGAVGNWESDANLPDPEMIRNLAALLRTTEEYLSGETNEIEQDELKDQPAKPQSLLRHVDDDTLQKNLESIAKRLAQTKPQERKHVIGSLREVLDEIEERELSSAATEKADQLAREILKRSKSGSQSGASGSDSKAA